MAEPDWKPKHDTYSAVRWSALSRYGAQATQFAISMVLARLLAPEYFGLMGMATVITGFAKTLNNLGFNVAIIQRKDVDRELLSTVFWVNLALCTIGTVVVMATAPLAAWMYDDPRVAPLVAALSLNLFLAAFITVPAALLQKQLDFRQLAIRELGGVIAMGLTGVAMAFTGFGVWSLVGASLSGQLASVLLLNCTNPFVPSFVIDRVRLKECMRFGIGITGTNIFSYFARNADNLIIGVFLGPVALGFYSLAYKIMLFPRNALTQVLNRVLFPKFSALQNDDRGLSRVTLLACVAIASLSFPLMGGFVVLSQPAVEMGLGEKWLPAVPIIWILSPIGALQSIWSVSTQIMLAKGRSDLYFRWGVANGCLMILSFFAGLPWGVVGVAAAYGMACLMWVPVSFWVAFQLVEGLTIKTLVSRLVPYLLLTAVMMAVVYATYHILATTVAPLVGLLAAVPVGVIVYVAGVWSFKLEAASIFAGILSPKLKQMLELRRKIASVSG